jgi:NAD(P)-dependent dehydrogenase (short-subunit alcohol dehydrogenase family)
MPANFRLDGRAALVTGGSRGIGRAIALALAAQGAAVGVCSRSSEACDRVVAEIEAQGGRALSLPGHVGRAAECAAVVDAMLAGLGRLDILVNDAATNPQFGPLLDAEESALDKVWEVNLKGAWRISRLAVEAWMGDHGGSIVNIASISGIRGDALIGAYSASKAALIGMTRVLARELGPRGIRVNAIAPGLVRTDFARVLVETPELRQRFTAASALGRVAEPDEIAGAAVFLASDAASFVTASVVTVDGGSV